MARRDVGISQREASAGFEGFTRWMLVAFVLLLGLAAANSAGWIVPVVDGDVYGVDEHIHARAGRL